MLARALPGVAPSLLLIYCCSARVESATRKACRKSPLLSARGRSLQRQVLVGVAVVLLLPSAEQCGTGSTVFSACEVGELDLSCQNGFCQASVPSRQRGLQGTTRSLSELRSLTERRGVSRQKLGALAKRPCAYAARSTTLNAGIVGFDGRCHRAPVAAKAARAAAPRPPKAAQHRTPSTRREASWPSPSPRRR